MGILQRMPFFAERRWAIVAVAVLSLFFLAYDLGSLPLTDFDEAIYAHVAENSLQNGQFLTLTRLGENWFEKPPLYLWMIMGSTQVFGWSEWSVRLPSALMAAFAVLLTYFVALELAGDRRLAFAAALFLLFTFPFYSFARQSRIDAPITAVMLFSFLSFLRGRAGERWYMGIGISAGIGIMLKSIIGLLGFFPIAIFSALHKDWRWQRDVYFWKGIGLGALIALPWHLYESFHAGRGLWDVYVVRLLLEHGFGMGTGVTATHYLQHLSRYAEPMVGGAIVFVPVIAAFAVRGRRRDAFWFCMAAALAILSFFMLATFKIYPYLLPLYPFVAIAFAAGLFILFEDILRWGPTSTLLAVGLFVLAAMNQTYSLTVSGANDYAYVPDEKAIGEHLRLRPEPRAVFACCRPVLETMIFYGKRSIEDATGKKIPPEPHFMIVGTSPGDAELKANDPYYAFAENIYAGPHLSLFRVDVRENLP